MRGICETTEFKEFQKTNTKNLVVSQNRKTHDKIINNFTDQIFL